MKDSEKNKHITTKIKEVAGIIAGITDIEFPAIARKNFYGLKEQLQVKLQVPLRKLESIMSKSFKDAVVGRVHSGLSSSSVFKTHRVTEKEWDKYFSTRSTDDLRIELVANLFFLFNLFEIKATNQFDNFELIASQLDVNLEKLSFAFTENYSIQTFNKGIAAVRELRSWAELKDFPKNDPLQIYLYQLDLFIDREVKQEVRNAFLTCIKKGNEGIKEMHEANYLGSAKRETAESYAVQKGATLQRRLSSVSSEQAQVVAPVRSAPPIPVPPSAPPRRRKGPALFANVVVDEVISSNEPHLANTPNP